MKYLLDTNVISELVGKKPDVRVSRWVDALDPNSVFLSALTIGELRKGIEKLPDSPRRTRLLAWLVDDLLMRFAGRVLPLDTEVLLTWGVLTGRLEVRGRPLPAIDSLLAAQAIQHACILVTRNESDFRDTGVQLTNPWAS